jgi:type II secretory pathway pseudopilin PulG
MRIAGNVDRPLRIITQSSSLSPRRLGQSGITYIGLLLAIVLIGIATAGLTPMWHTMVQRDREAELLFRLGEFRRAIARYRQDHGRYPARLKDLLEDKTQLQVRRYLRRIYTDPMSRAADWTKATPRAFVSFRIRGIGTASGSAGEVA